MSIFASQLAIPREGDTPDMNNNLPNVFFGHILTVRDSIEAQSSSKRNAILP